MKGFKNIKNIKQRIIKYVLDTDMIYHQKHLNESKKYAINKEGFDKDFYLSMLLHTSDISNLCREFVIAEQWGIRINQEMAEQ